MENFEHTLADLFAQLGLPNTATDIDQFIHTHRPIADDVALADAPCWSPSQAAFLSEAIAADLDWSELVDQLNNRLRD